MRSLSQDLRERIIEARQKGETTSEVCCRFAVSPKSVERYWKQHISTGHCRSKKIGGYRRSRLEKHDGKIQEWIGKQCDLTLKEIQQRCRKQLKIQIGINALWHRLDKLGLSYKKNRRMPSSGIEKM